MEQFAAVSGWNTEASSLLGQEHVGGHDHVIAGVAGQQLGLQGFVGVEDVVDQLDAESSAP